MRAIFQCLKFISALAVLVIGISVAPVFAANTPQEAANKKLVLDFYLALNEADAANAMQDRIAAIAEHYLSPQYQQHTLLLPGPGSDREKLIRMFQSRPGRPGGQPSAMPKQRTDAVMAEGDRVMLLTSRDLPDPVSGEIKPSYVFNMFRVVDGQLREHWDVSAGYGGPPPPSPSSQQPPAPNLNPKRQ